MPYIRVANGWSQEEKVQDVIFFFVLFPGSKREVDTELKERD